ncbi:hypothetical protein P7_193 [Pectobacterium phage vB_PcaM_P7_Pc]|nr:hypothetical protein P7_193 [Pectobacterium phage vB_PcaM_P7_Pc]
MHAHHKTYSLVEKKTGAVFADSLGRLFIYKDLPSAEKGAVSPWVFLRYRASCQEE